MAVITEDVMPRFEMGRVASRTFHIIASNILSFAMLSVIPGVPLVMLARMGKNSFLHDGRLDFSMLGYAGVIWLAYIFSVFLFQASVVHGAVVTLNGKRASFFDCLSTGLESFLALFGLTLVMVIGIMLGFVLVVIPGIIAMLMWSVAVPVYITERTGVFDALRRSRQLTSGHKWAIFGLLLAFGILSMVIALVAALSTGPLLPSPQAAASGASVGRAIVSTGASMINAVISASLIASIYYELRVMKEGIGPEALASVFD